MNIDMTNSELLHQAMMTADDFLASAYRSWNMSTIAFKKSITFSEFAKLYVEAAGYDFRTSMMVKYEL